MYLQTTEQVNTPIMPGDPNLEFLTLDEAARILKVNPTTIGRRVQRGEIAAIHIGRAVRIRRQDLERFIERHLEGHAG